MGKLLGKGGPYEITNLMIIDRANVHHSPVGKAIYTFNQRDLLAFTREMIACATGMPYPGPLASPLHLHLREQRKQRKQSTSRKATCSTIRTPALPPTPPNAS